MSSASALAPVARRPGFPAGYGIRAESEGMLDWDWAVGRLEAGRNYWVSTTSPDGRPHAMPVWGVWLGDGLRFSTSAASRKGRNLARDPRVVVHLESGDEVVILEGEVEETTLDDPLADAYEAKYEYRPSSSAGKEGPWYVLRPGVAYAWLERDYPRTATRFDFSATLGA